MNFKAMTLAGVAALGLLVSAASAGNKYVGYNTHDVDASADARITVPFTAEATEVNGQTEFAVFGTTATGITVSGTPFTANAFNNTFYVQFISGDAEGLWATITSNTNNTLNLDDSLGDVLGEVGGNETFRIYEHLTVNDVFPPNLAGKHTAAAGSPDLLFSDVGFNTKALLFSNDITAGDNQQNRSATGTSLFNGTVGAWIGGNTIVRPQTQLVFRNESATAYSFITLGEVPDWDPSWMTAPGGDLVMGSGLPVPVTVDAMDLGVAPGSPANARTLLFFESTGPSAGINSSSTATSLFFPAAWTGGVGSRVVDGSESFTLRFSATDPAGNGRITVPNPID